MLEKAAALDPNYADAYASLALYYLAGTITQYDKDPKAPERIIALAQRAIALDDSNWMAYMVLGEEYGFMRQYDRAVASYQRAIALDPNNPTIYYWFGDVLGFVGKPAETIRADEKATRLDPRNADLYAMGMGQGYNWMGKYAEALPFLKQHAARYPDNLFVHLELASDYVNLGRYKEARAEATEVMRLNPQFSLEEKSAPQWSQCSFKDEAICKRWTAALRKAGLR